MRIVYFFTITSLSLLACGGDDDNNNTPDAAVDSGFNLPTVTLKANNEVADDQWEELGPANLGCLGTPSTDEPSAGPVTLTTKVTDFQTGNAVPGSMVEAFAGVDYMTPFAGTPVTADSNAMVSLVVPSGTKRFGYRMTSSSSMPTFLLNQTLPSSTEAMQTVGNIQSVSKSTAATLPALIGQTRTDGTGVVAGALRDCDGNEISGFIATMSSTPAEANTVMGADTYYFNSMVGLPDHHKQQPYASPDGLFMIIEVPSTNPTGYVQMWGFPTADDMEMGKAGLKLIAELQVPILADTVITGSYEPMRQ